MSNPNISFQVKLTRSGKHFVEVYDGSKKIGVSRKTYSNGEEAIREMRSALEHQRLANELIKR